MGTLQPAKYGKVVGRLLAVVADGPDEDEHPVAGGYPDARPLAGSVTFTPRASTILVAGAEPDPVTAFAHPVTAQLDENGYLTLNGKKGVFLLCPSAETNPSHFTYSVRYSVTLDERPVSAPTFDIELVEYVPGPDPLDPDEGSTAVNLTLVTPAQPSGGTPIVRGPAGDSVEGVSLSSDGLSLVFHVQRESGPVDETVAIPSLATATTAAQTATTAAGTATTQADRAFDEAERAQRIVDDAAAGVVPDNSVNTAKIVDDSVSSPKLAPAVRADLASRELAANKGAANGYPPLDAGAKVPATYLPSYVDDVVEYANQGAFPASGETGKIYTALDSNKIYRWSGSAYVEISPSPGSTDAVPEGSANLYFTTARAKAAVAADISAKYTKPAGGIPASDLATGRVVGSNNGTAANLTIWVGTEAQYNAATNNGANEIPGFVYLRGA